MEEFEDIDGDLKEDDEENMEHVVLKRPAVEPVEVLAILDERPGDVHCVCPAPGAKD